MYPRITQKVNNNIGLFPLRSLHQTAYEQKLQIQYYKLESQIQ